MTLVAILRAEQEADEDLGPFFQVLYVFAERLLEEQWPQLKLDVPFITLDTVGRKDGYFVPRDGLTVPRVNLNPSVLRTGRDAAEVLAHELVHMKLASEGKYAKRNYHAREFHEEMKGIGILTEGRNGRHIGYTEDDNWQALMELNGDLELDQFILPGMDAKPKRKMYKHKCPKCGANFRHRTRVEVICAKCKEPFTWKRT